MTACFHCGDNCDTLIRHDDKSFCCHGCKTVYDILNDNGLSFYYDLEQTPGVSPKSTPGAFDFLDNEVIVQKILEFDDEQTQIVSLTIPSIHCSSCIWILENLSKLDPGIRASTVNFPAKSVRITYSAKATSLKNVVVLLSKIGYEPSLSMDDFGATKKKVDRSLIYKLGVAGFAFGNVMFLSFPEYFEVNEFWLERFKHVFRWLMFAFSVPVVFYSGKDYFISAFKGLKSRMLNIDVPIALGIATLFIRSTAEIALDLGSGFFDSLTGLVFFLLLGKFFQQKTYSFLSFERDYKSYFPISVTRLKGKKEEHIPAHEVQKGDLILIRNEEIIPVDGILTSGDALIDYSFVTGETDPHTKTSGDKIFAGGKQKGGVIGIEVLKPVAQSYLTQLWSNEAFAKDKPSLFQNLTDAISKQFTLAVLSIAVLSTAFWLWYDPSKAMNVFTAVLIIACPCAIALSAPFTLGNILRIFGKNRFYLKDANVVERMGRIDTVVFDKTGTLTTQESSEVTYQGIPLTPEEEKLLNGTLQASNHPLSRTLYGLLAENGIQTPTAFAEYTGQGLKASGEDGQIKIGTYDFVTDEKKNSEIDPEQQKTTVHIESNNAYKGYFEFHNRYRDGITEVFENLSADKELIVLSGDNDGERKKLSRLLPHGVRLLFNQKPEDKLEFIKKLQSEGKHVMMVGDGLNDSGALAQSDVGIAISENINVFSPACDGILDATRFKSLTDFFSISNKSIAVIKWSFLLSLAYNIIGLSFAVTGHLKPVVAAILMPLSSISIVVFATVMTQWIGKRVHAKSKT